MGIMAICCLLCLFFLITWLHLWLSARTFCAIDLLGLDWVLIYCQETNWSPRYRICLLSFAILLGLDLYPGSCWLWCSMASGARVGKIYPLDEADVSCLDLFILCCYVSFATVDKSSYCGHGHLVIWSSARQGRIITGKTTEQVSRFKLVRCRPPVDWSKHQMVLLWCPVTRCTQCLVLLVQPTDCNQHQMVQPVCRLGFRHAPSVLVQSPQSNLEGICKK